MQTVNAVRGNARTFLTHLFGADLNDEDRYMVERFRSMASGEIRRRPGDKAPAKGRPKAKRQIVSVRTVKKLRPARDEIIVCTGIRTDAGIQYWGDLAAFSRGRATGLHPAFNSNPVGGTQLCPIETPIWAACVTANGSGEGPPSAWPGGCA